jgi:hypothetical protein
MATGLRQKCEPDPKPSELNLQTELNQATETVGTIDLAEITVCHSIVRGPIVGVIENVKHLRLENQLARFEQGKGLGRVEVYVFVRRIMQVVSTLVPSSECSGL